MVLIKFIESEYAQTEDKHIHALESFSLKNLPHRNEFKSETQKLNKQNLTINQNQNPTIKNRTQSFGFYTLSGSNNENDNSINLNPSHICTVDAHSL